MVIVEKEITMKHVASGFRWKSFTSISALAMILTATPSSVRAADPSGSAPTIQDEKEKSGGPGKVQQREVKPSESKPRRPVEPDVVLSPPSPPSPADSYSISKLWYHKGKRKDGEVVPG
jgi:hypothetical protein